MNEPLKQQAEYIIRKRAVVNNRGQVFFETEKEAMLALIEFAKFYDKFEHEPIEEKIKDGDNPNIPLCAVCQKSFGDCFCGLG